MSSLKHWIDLPGEAAFQRGEEPVKPEAHDPPKWFEWDLQLPSGGRLTFKVCAQMTRKDLKLIKAVMPMILEVLDECEPPESQQTAS